MIGETRGIQRMDALSKKADFEKHFQEWADSVSGQQSTVRSQLLVPGTGIQDYTLLLPEFKRTYQEYLPVDLASVYLTEAGMGIEIVRFAQTFRNLVKISKIKEPKKEEIEEAVRNLGKAAHAFYKDYQPSLDERVMIVLLETMKENMEKNYLPSQFENIEKKYGSDFSLYAQSLFRQSIFADSSKLYRFLKEYKATKSREIDKDPAFQLAESISLENEKQIIPRIDQFNRKIDSLQRLYMAAQMKMQVSKRFYPDANSTMRVSYGKVDDYYPMDAVHYSYFTTSDGILEKEDPLVYDYQVDPTLKSLFISKNFGGYADHDGKLHVAFTASNHTTGGNSGSPVLDANGYLIGLNFDRNWEGTMSDLMYDPDQCRNITLDIRYCLFIIDRFAGASNLIREMEIME